jgi:hypothetical protein
MPNQPRRDQPRPPTRRPPPAARTLSGFEAAGLVKFAYFTHEAPEPGTLLFTAFRRNMPPEIREVPVSTAVTFFYGIQQTGCLLDIQVRWINPDGAVARTSDQPMDQSREGALWTWQVDRLEQRDLTQAGVWAVELLISGHRVGRYPLLVRPAGR